VEQEADESPDWEPGDLVLTVREVNNAAANGGFRRRGSDLFVDVPIGAYEALGGGFERTITHLDGRNITLKRSQGKIIQSGWSPMFMLFLTSKATSKLLRTKECQSFDLMDLGSYTLHIMSYSLLL
jgi:DnaJ C terminal domain